MLPTTLLRAPHTTSVFKRAQNGLFAGKTKQYGNNVPHSKQKTRRSWLPNVQSKRLYSEILGTTMKTKVTTRALKTIDKYGGIDGYLLNAKISSLGDAGLRMREQLLEAKEAALEQQTASSS
ncbi:39S ribosomal protein L24, mitochondrial [Tulasnella sp. 424]|nr:39S ribosomal protein L24, mitochondrial [Tulasnella sp. 424]KAG8974873.1 39S ribosomal protein L24, mitochondrial [Tulasnella sp. 425]